MSIVIRLFTGHAKVFLVEVFGEKRKTCQSVSWGKQLGF
jgi:hypothetical protein